MSVRSLFAAAHIATPAPGQASWEIVDGEHPPIEGHGPIRRSTKITEGNPLSVTPAPHVKTIHDILVHSIHKYPTRNCLGERALVGIVEESKPVPNSATNEVKIWKFFEMGPYQWLNYSQVYQKCVDVGAGLANLGLKVQENVNIFATTSPSWMIMAHACYTQNLSISTSYDSLGEEGLSFSLNEGGVTAIFTQPDLFPMIKKVSGKVPTLKYVFYKSPSTEEEVKATEKIKKDLPNLTFYSLEELEMVGAAKPVALRPPVASDLCCIMYTSGSTGNPKGVMLTHANILAAVAASELNTRDIITCEDVYLAYLPLAHVLEFVVETFALFNGCSLGYGNPRTLTDDSVRNCKGDIRELCPTFMCGVPAVWERIRKGIMSKLSKASGMAQRVFWSAYNLKKSLMGNGLPHLFMDRNVFKSIQGATGGRLKLALSGGAPLASETQEFLTICICQVLQGYGMTESSGGIAIQSPTDKGIIGVVGAPFTCAEIKLVAANAYNPNPTDGKTNPQGEVWCRGAQICKGYFKQPALTAETITEDGWLRTGDVGEWRPDGSLAIIDRIKNLVKLAHGEYVALEKLEAQYKTSKYLSNMCVHADPSESNIVALLVPNPAEIKILLREYLLKEDDFNNPKILKVVGEDLLSCAKSANFKGSEVLKVIYIVNDDWTPENGFLTAAQKIKRKDILAKYAPEINKMYNRK